MRRSESVRSEILEFILAHFPAAKRHTLTPDTTLLESGIVDSVGILEIVGFIEQKFQVTVGDDDLVPENFSSVGNIAAFIEARLEIAARNDGAAASACGSL